MSTEEFLIKAAIEWANAKEAFISAEQHRHEIGEANVRSRGAQTQEYGQAYFNSGHAAALLFEAEKKLLYRVKAYVDA